MADGAVRGRALLIASMFVCAAPASARADWHVTPFIGVTFAGDTNIIDLENAATDAKLTFGGAVAVLGEMFGVETEFGYSPRYFQRAGNARLVTQSSVVTLMGNLVVAAPRRWTAYSLRPFASGGVGLMRASIDDVLDVFPVRSNLLGLNVGGGVIGFFDEKRGLRLDLRHFRNLSAGDERDNLNLGTTRLSYWRASAGLVLKY